MKKTLLALGLILAAALSRLLPHPPNFTPLTAMALCGGVYLERRFALFLPLAALFVSDLFIGFHRTMPFVYLSFLLIGLIGLWLAKRKRTSLIFSAAAASSILFFLITNFGVWVMDGSMYSRSIEGLIACYVAAIPFFRNTLFGDLVYTAFLFGLFELVEPLVRRKKETASV